MSLLHQELSSSLSSESIDRLFGADPLIEGNFAAKIQFIRVIIIIRSRSEGGDQK